MEKTGYAFIRGVSGGNIFTSILIIFIGLMMLYAILVMLVFMVQEKAKINDELEKRVFINALAKSFMIILLLHFIQMIVRVVHYEQTGMDINLLVKPGLLIYGLDGPPKNHFESFGVDLAIFGFCLLISRWRYRTWSLKEGIARIHLGVRHNK